ncbi:hypothetical protein CS022_20770 [Veronia nyctiphanis]|uniref:Uncharacterized protein n=2 Tax=Veronia nyctiphanis TaxID=1278244 RepID=A0A4Q0YM72_9GAMM|nr:hypothetical protein CS022_20770 [Veronia nyctiphanis]
MLTGIMAFMLVFGFIASMTGLNFIQLKDASSAHLVLAEKGNKNAEGFDYEPVEEELANPTYFNLLREASDPEYAYGDGSYLDAYSAHDERSNFEKKNFGIHMIAGSACLILAVFQFWPSFRRKHKKIHRVMGVLYVTAAFTLGINVWIFLVNAGVETTWDQLVGNWGLYILSSTEMLAICIAGFFLLKRQYGAHMGWMAVSLGSFLTAPWQRYDWLMLAWLDTGQTFQVINGAVDTVLYTQAYFTAYWVIVMNRQSSPEKPRFSFEGLSSGASRSILGVTLLAVVTTFVFYTGSNGLFDSELVGQSMNFSMFEKEQQVLFGDNTFLFPLFIILALGMTTLSAYMLLNYQQYDAKAIYSVVSVLLSV